MFWLGFFAGCLLIPAVLLLMAALERLRHGWWTPLDSGPSCDACRQVPDDRWSPIYVCDRCGDRQVRSFLIVVFGMDRMGRWVKRGPRDEAWLNGETP